MLYQLILLIVSATLLTTFGLVLHNIIKCQLAYWSFKKKTNNLPVSEGREFIGNHVAISVTEDMCNQQIRGHARLGKTYGWLYNEKFAVSTIDLDLIKMIIYDEPDKHINRFRLNLPIHEIEQSMMFAEDDKWRKLRRHFAPAFK